MPTIECSHKDLCRLIGKNIPVKTLQDEGILYVKGELEETKGDSLKIDIKDTNRPDLWSTEGIARELKSKYVKPKFPNYTIKKSDVIVKVDKSLKNIRPYTVCAVAKNLKLDEHALSQIIQLQEKVSATFGRNRREVAIGVYDLSRIAPPIQFTTVAPTGIKFVPLDFDKELTPKEILELHPKGKEFGHLLKDKPLFPLFIDSKNQVLSMPPIINSNYTGKVTKQTKDLFIECSGFDLRFLTPALNVIVSALADRGGDIYSVDVIYPDKKTVTPDLTPKKFSLDINYVKTVSGLDLKEKEIVGLLEKANYKVVNSGNKLSLLYPAYRQDIMHAVDVVEDLIIAYGYNKIEPIEPKLFVRGGENGLELFTRKVSQAMIGLGLQETLSYILTNKENLFKKMLLAEEQIVEIENPMSANWSVFRSWLLPSIFDFLSHNQHIEFPQKIFEVGDCIILDPKQETRTSDIRKLACLLTDSSAGYEDISSVLDSFLSSLGLTYSLTPHTHPSFIQGRTAKIIVKGKELGLIGEISPAVLNNWNLENPAAAFEINLTELMKLL